MKYVYKGMTNTENGAPLLRWHSKLMEKVCCVCSSMCVPSACNDNNYLIYFFRMVLVLFAELWLIVKSKAACARFSTLTTSFFL